MSDTEQTIEELTDIFREQVSILQERLPSRAEAREKLLRIGSSISTKMSQASSRKASTRTSKRMSGKRMKELNIGAETISLEEIDDMLSGIPILNTIEEVSGIPRIIFFFIGVLLVVGLTLVGLKDHMLGILMTRILGFAYPAYASFKALQSEEKDDDTQWLTFWFVFAFFSVLEQTILQPLVLLMPLYFSFKIVFLVWCQFYRGGEILYQLVVRPATLELIAYQESLTKDEY